MDALEKQIRFLLEAGYDLAEISTMLACRFMDVVAAKKQVDTERLHEKLVHQAKNATFISYRGERVAFNYDHDQLWRDAEKIREESMAATLDVAATGRGARHHINCGRRDGRLGAKMPRGVVHVAHVRGYGFRDSPED